VRVGLAVAGKMDRPEQGPTHRMAHLGATLDRAWGTIDGHQRGGVEDRRLTVDPQQTAVGVADRDAVRRVVKLTEDVAKDRLRDRKGVRAPTLGGILRAQNFRFRRSARSRDQRGGLQYLFLSTPPLPIGSSGPNL
jgi:hypothetical protein